MINTEIANDENVSLNDGGTLSGNLIFPKFFCLKIRYISTVKIPTNKPTIIPFPSKYVKLSIPLSEVHAICYRSPHNPLKKPSFLNLNT